MITVVATPPMPPPNLPDGDPDRALATRRHRRILVQAVRTGSTTVSSLGAPYIADLVAGGYVTATTRWKWLADESRHVVAIEVTPTVAGRDLPRYAVIVADLDTGHPTRYGEVEIGGEGYTAARAVVDGLGGDVWSTVLSLRPVVSQ